MYLSNHLPPSLWDYGIKLLYAFHKYFKSLIFLTALQNSSEEEFYCSKKVTKPPSPQQLSTISSSFIYHVINIVLERQLFF